MKKATVITFRKIAHKVSFQSIFHAPSQNFKILAIPSVLAHEKSYEDNFIKKCKGHKLCAKSRAKSRFDRFSCIILGFQNTGNSQRISPWEVIRARFNDKTRLSKTLHIVALNVSFRSIFLHRLGISKYWPFPAY
ncbi:hypothetical protein GW17_00043803 [Ensete ventricosum]|nr:hypothetical protein GW17_00043803 [Ensete ventricosum]RZS18487.1 hypothetical protein BHM03_00050759 [Ensete ventricosum]